MNSNEKSKKNKLGLGLVLLILIIFPLISVIYLNRGISFRKAMLSETKIKGELGELAYENLDKEEKFLSEKKGKSIALIFSLESGIPLNEIEDVTKINHTYFSKLYQQFGKRSDVLFLLNKPERLTKSQLDSISSDSNMYQTEIGYYDAKDFNIPDTVNYDNSIVLLDTAFNIINYYHYGIEKDMNKLVEHISIIIPEVSKKKYKSSKSQE